MELRDHLRTTGTALKHWLIAQTYDSLAVGALWLVGLLLIGVPGAPLWALMAFVFQFIPHIGLVLALLGPGIAAAISGGLELLLYVLMLYAAIALMDGLALQPHLMKRTARVPIWASILTPLVLGALFSFWGVLLSAPLLAIIYAYRSRFRPALSNQQSAISSQNEPPMDADPPRFKSKKESADDADFADKKPHPSP